MKYEMFINMMICTISSSSLVNVLNSPLLLQVSKLVWSTEKSYPSACKRNGLGLGSRLAAIPNRNYTRLGVGFPCASDQLQEVYSSSTIHVLSLNSSASF